MNVRQVAALSLALASASVNAQERTDEQMKPMTLTPTAAFDARLVNNPLGEVEGAASQGNAMSWRMEAGLQGDSLSSVLQTRAAVDLALYQFPTLPAGQLNNPFTRVDGSLHLGAMPFGVVSPYGELELRHQVNLAPVFPDFTATTTTTSNRAASVGLDILPSKALHGNANVHMRSEALYRGEDYALRLNGVNVHGAMVLTRFTKTDYGVEAGLSRRSWVEGPLTGEQILNTYARATLQTPTINSERSQIYMSLAAGFNGNRSLLQDEYLLNTLDAKAAVKYVRGKSVKYSLGAHSLHEVQFPVYAEAQRNLSAGVSASRSSRKWYGETAFNASRSDIYGLYIENSSGEAQIPYRQINSLSSELSLAWHLSNRFYVNLSGEWRQDKNKELANLRAVKSAALGLSWNTNPDKKHQKHLRP